MYNNISCYTVALVGYCRQSETAKRQELRQEPTQGPQAKTNYNI